MDVKFDLSRPAKGRCSDDLDCVFQVDVKMGAVSYSEALVTTYEVTLCLIQGYLNLNFYRHENFKGRIKLEPFRTGC
jgi:hypothetical protein